MIQKYNVQSLFCPETLSSKGSKLYYLLINRALGHSKLNLFNVYFVVLAFTGTLPFSRISFEEEQDNKY